MKNLENHEISKKFLILTKTATAHKYFKPALLV